MEDVDDLFTKKDMRKRKEKKRSLKQTNKEMEECTRENFKKMKEEIDELRKKETDRDKEFAELKKKIEDQSRNTKSAEPEYALQFTKEAYLSKGFIESAKWIKEAVAKNMMVKMNDDDNRDRFEVLQLSKKSSTYLGIRTCARYNRGEQCNFGKWHTTHKPDYFVKNDTQPDLDVESQDTYRAHRLRNFKQSEVPQSSIQERIGTRNEIRLHACTLCMEAFGSANGHSVLNCPWILKKNWNH